MRYSVRAREPADDRAIAAVVAAAFGGNAEVALIEALRRDGDMVLEYVAVEGHVAAEGTDVIAHVAYSRLDVRAGAKSLRAVALAPLAVVPHRQRQDIGDTLTRLSLEHLMATGEELAVVLGHPNYYPRFGFSPLIAKLLDARYSGPSFMALELQPSVLTDTRWKVSYPRAFSPADPH